MENSKSQHKNQNHVFTINSVTILKFDISLNSILFDLFTKEDFLAHVSLFSLKSYKQKLTKFHRIKWHFCGEQRWLSSQLNEFYISIILHDKWILFTLLECELRFYLFYFLFGYFTMDTWIEPMNSRIENNQVYVAIGCAKMGFYLIHQ